MGIHKRRRGCTRRDPDAEPADDLVNRQFTVDGPDRLWVSDITEHPTAEGKVYFAVVLDAWSRRVIGWSIADHIRAELVVDALQMAIWRRRPPAGQTVHHSDHGSQYTSWAFGRRLRAAGVLGSMGSIGDAYDNAMAESFFSTLQRELLDEQPRWATRHQLAQAVFEWIEALYNPRRRHSSIGRVQSPSSSKPATTSTNSDRPHDERGAQNRTLRCSQRPAINVDGMNTPDDRSLWRLSVIPTPEPSGKPGEAHATSSLTADSSDNSPSTPPAASNHSTTDTADLL